jgi:hypothetical protein
VITALLASLFFTGGVRAELPSDGPAALGGMLVGLRWHPVPGAYLGGQLSGSLGGDETNPEAVQLTSHIDGIARLGLAHDTSVSRFRLEARTGVSRVSDWPFGALPSRSQFSPVVGVAAAIDFPLFSAWGHPMSLDLVGGIDAFRLGDEWVRLPMVGIGFTGQLTRQRDE